MIYWKLNGKPYPFVPLTDMTPRDILSLQLSLADADFTRLRTADEVLTTLKELYELPKPEREKHPEFGFCTIVQMWAAIRSTGERMTLDELLDGDVRDIEFVMQPEAGDGEGEGKAAPPSVSGGGNRAARRKKKKAAR